MAPSMAVHGVQVNPVIQLVPRENYLSSDRLEPTDTQKTTLIVAGVFFGLFLMFPFGRYILYPFEMLVTALHEFCHAFAALLTCTKVHYIVINPNASGLTSTAGYKNTMCAVMICSAGYVGSSLIGCVLVFCGFNIVASKGATLGLGAIFLITLFWARKDWITWVTCLAASGLIVGCWLIDHARPLRYLVLLLGVMSSMWSLKDTYDILRGKIQNTDAHNLAEVAGGNAKMWALLWNVISLAALAGAILLALMVFKESDEEMWADSQDFLPTRFRM